MLENCSKELEILERDTSKLKNVVPPFAISYDEAVEDPAEVRFRYQMGRGSRRRDETILDSFLTACVCP